MNWRERPALNLLVSYPYFTKGMRAVFDARDPSEFNLMLDSGAFSAWNTGGAISLDDYCAFVRSLPADWNVDAIQLDVIGDHKATFKNFLAMLDQGVDAIPVYTRGAPLNDREKMYERKDYVAIGGMVKSPEYLAFVRHFMRTNHDRRVHWLGYTDLADVKRYAPTSVDSSSITSTERYGAIGYYVGAGKLRRIHKSTFVGKPPGDFVRSCRMRGFTGAEVKRLGLAESWRGHSGRLDAENGRGFASFVGYTHFLAQAYDIERNTGTRYYLAGATPGAVRGMFAAMDFMMERGGVRCLT